MKIALVNAPTMTAIPRRPMLTEPFRSPTVRMIEQIGEAEMHAAYWKEEWRKEKNIAAGLRRELKKLKAERGLLLTGAAKHRVMAALDAAIAKEFEQ